MVYYGALSKGCERCRRRKIRCDQQRPSCRRCMRSDIECPGYRDLHDVLFRDESRKVVHRAQRHGLSQTEMAIPTATSTPTTRCSTVIGILRTQPRVIRPSDVFTASVRRFLLPPMSELAASFYFSKYTSHETPYSSDYLEWLSKCYFDSLPACRALQFAIEAVGLAGISNVSPTLAIRKLSRVRYCQSLAAMTPVLRDPIHAVTDAALMTVILLGFFETVSFEDSDQYRAWTSHVHGATALLEMRGYEQFTRELGAQLYVQIRSQILSLCTLQYLPVPPTLVHMTTRFQTSNIRREWHKSNIASPSSISVMSFKAINLRAALHKGNADLQGILQAAVGIDEDLQSWAAGLSSEWAYTTINASDTAADGSFLGKRHLYSSSWIAEVWNNWRVIRIFVNQLIIRTEKQLAHSCRQVLYSYGAQAIIHHLSQEICISSVMMIEAQRMMSLVRPLCIVALEEANNNVIRNFSLQQLRIVSATTGVRQAGVLANAIHNSLNETKKHPPPPDSWSIPLMPFC